MAPQEEEIRGRVMGLSEVLVWICEEVELYMCDYRFAKISCISSRAPLA